MPSNSQVEQTQVKGKNQKYTWSEVQKHCTEDNAWMVYANKVYNVTQWAKSHPGGDMIFLGAGTDASILVKCYHPAGINEKILEKYCIGEVIPEPQYQSYYSDIEKDEFYNTLQKRVLDHFKKRGIHYKGESNIQMYIKTLIIMVTYFTSLYFMTVHGSFIAALLFGIFSAEIGVSVMHDGSHGAFSKIKFLNKLTCWTMDLIGASSYVWEIQHVAGHHLHTNNHNEQAKYVEVDPDVFTSYPFIRMHPDSERKSYHKYQHIYTPILFALFTFIKVLYTDFSNFYDSCIMHLSMKPRLNSKASWVRVFLMKILSVTYTIVLPMYFNGFVKGFWLYFTFHCCVGLILACMFQVTHLNEGCTFLSEKGDPFITKQQKEAIQYAQKKYGITQTKKYDPRSWAAMQCITSCNWALDSFFWTHFSGGLNHQIEHHLFPGVCHVHYRDIQQIVEKTCAEYGVAYLQHKDFISAFGGLLGYLKKLGNPPAKTA